MRKKQKSTTKTCGVQICLDDLPNELLIHIFRNLTNFGDLANVGMASKNLLRVSKNSEFYPKFCTDLFKPVGGLLNSTRIWNSDDYKLLWFKLGTMISNADFDLFVK